MKKRHLELFSGTHSFGKVSSKMGFEVYSLDRDLGAECPLNSGYISKNHFKEDIMTWNYKQFPKGYFKLITASPVCIWWSNLRNTWIGRKMKQHNGKIFTLEILHEDIEKYGIPMIEKVFEILDYFNPKYYIIEIPAAAGKMKFYINDLIPYYDIDYCKYTDWGYKKTTRFWTNIEGFKPKICKNDCSNIIKLNGSFLHRHRMGTKKTIIDNGKIIRVNTKELTEKYKNYKNIQKEVDNRKLTSIYERYRIPKNLIEELFNNIY